MKLLLLLAGLGAIFVAMITFMGIVFVASLLFERWKNQRSDRAMLNKLFEELENEWRDRQEGQGQLL